MLSLQALILSLLPMFPSAGVDRWIVETTTADAPCLVSWWSESGNARSGRLIKPLPVEGWWVVEATKDESAILQGLPCIVRLFPDRLVEWRKTPDDPGFINQSDLTLMGMSGAWDIATGGVTVRGDSIVVAVIDGGFQADHDDLAANIWVNRAETPGDGIDNDGNGYLDDYRGYNVITMNDNHEVNSHGTSVCGIIGARGDNATGVTGVNWQVKIMPVSARYESEVIESYQYVLDMRKRYRESGGAQGAFVVAVNLSAGIDNAWAVDHPLWCEMYDKLGAEGVLGICAAPNRNSSVDVVGDMPTTCASPYMIAVTNVDLTDELVGNAGFGEQSIDIGAPGHGTFTIAAGNQYKEFNGTSSATPHVAGLIALLYATDCPGFLTDLGADPALVAARVRDVIFETGKPNNSLEGITTTGRRIQADAALRASRNLCGGGEPRALDITGLLPNPVSAQGSRITFIAKDIDAGPFRIDICGPNGARVGRFDLSPAELANGYVDLDTRGLPAGVYLVTLWQGRKKASQKLLIY